MADKLNRVHNAIRLVGYLYTARPTQRQASRKALTGRRGLTFGIHIDPQLFRDLSDNTKSRNGQYGNSQLIEGH